METGGKIKNANGKILLLLRCALLAVMCWSSSLAVAQVYSSSNKKAVKEFEKGQSALYQGKASAAMQAFRKAAEIDPAFVEPRLMLAEWYEEAEDAAQAKQYYYAAMAANASFFPPAWVVLGDLELKDGDNTKALDNYNHYLTASGATSAKKDESLQRRAEYGRDCALFRANALAHPVPFTPRNLGEGVNSSNDEYLPALTADGKTLIFTRRFPRKATTTAHTAEEEDFYQSRWVTDDNASIDIPMYSNGHWGHAIRMAEPVNSNDNEGAQCISRDGRIMIFTACGRPDGGGRCDLYICMRIGKQWTAPRNMGPTINSGAWESQPSLSIDGKTLYFVSDRKEGYGGTDIWKSTLKDGQWTTPVNMGPDINTAGNEHTPFIHYDNQTLYFASDGLVGMGGSDIFVCRRETDPVSGKTRWSKPENLGYPINTGGDESGLIVSPDGRTAFFSSDQLDGRGRQDLYSFLLPEEARPQKVVYKEASDTLAQLAVGESLTLNNIFFETAKWTLLEVSKVELDHVAEQLQQHEALRIEVGGHTDNVGDNTSNLRLSEQRAKTVYDYLVQHGVSADRLTYKGYGESKPIATNDTEEGRAANRRTTFTITGK